MTRKQYVSKMMRFQRNVSKRHRENTGEKFCQQTDKVLTPKWGTLIEFGRHKGEKLVSYKQAWDMVLDVFELIIPEYLEGIE